MSDAQTKVIISGDASGAVKAIEQTKNALTDASRQMTGALAPLSEGLSKMQGAFLALGTLLAGGALFKASVAAANEWNAEVGKLARSLGTTTENASTMAVALDHLGISSDTVIAATNGLAKQLKTNEEGFQKLGIQTRDFATGALRPAGQIMADVNTHLAAQKNGVQQNIEGMTFYGKVWKEARDIIKLTAEQMATAKQRAEELHLVIGPEGMLMTRQYKEQQRDLALVWKSIEIQLGTALLPVLVKLGAFMSGQGPQASKTFAFALQGVGFTLASLWLGMQKVGGSLAAFAAQAAAVASGNFDLARNIGKAWEEDDAAINKQFQDMVSGFQSTEDAAKRSAKTRASIEQDLQNRLSDLAGLRAKSAAGVDAQILKSDEERTNTQIANAEKVRDALRTAWQASIDGARKAYEDAKALSEKALGTRATGADKAAEIRTAQLPQAEQDAANQDNYRRLADSATESAGLAKLAALQGRTQAAAKLADQASKDAERAARFADKLPNPEEQAQAAERLADAQATAQEAQAAIKAKEAKDLESVAAAQQKTIVDLDQQISDLKNKAAQVAIDLQIDKAISDVAALQAQLDALPPEKTITVTVNTVQVGAASSAPNSFSSDSSMTGFAWGGWTGPGSKFQPAGIVHANEFVTRSEIVNQRGAIAFLQRFNREGMRALPGYASGGLVAGLNMPSLSSPSAAASRAAAVFHFPGMGSYSVSMADDALSRLQVNFQRLALQKGGRR